MFNTVFWISLLISTASKSFQIRIILTKNNFKCIIFKKLTFNFLFSDIFHFYKKLKVINSVEHWQLVR